MAKPRPWKVTPLMFAAKDGQSTKVIQLINSSVNLEDLDDAGNSALNMAAENGHLEILKKLVAAGAKIDVINERGETALLMAERWQRYTCMITLIRNGASLWREDHQGYSFDKRNGGFEWWGNADEAWQYVRNKMDNIGNQ